MPMCDSVLRWLALTCIPAALLGAPLNAEELTDEERAAALVEQMTLDEKISQLDDDAEAIPRLEVPAYHWWSEGLHGVARQGVATVFPQAIGMAATFDAPLIQQVAGVIGTEFRALYNHKRADDGSSVQYQGLTVWSPNINIFRDPRWGRGQETYGEDPYLTSRMGVAFVQGLQGPDPENPVTVATVKHYAVHSGPEHSRHSDNFNPSAYDLEDTYLPAFRATITEGGARSVMCAYNRVYLQPACASEFLLDHTLRRDWGFKGYVVSDCSAVHDIHLPHRHAYVKTEAEAFASALEAGMDIICGWYPTRGPNGADPLALAVREGRFDEDLIDQAVTRLFAARFALGMFDEPEPGTPSATSPDLVDIPAHRALNLDVARASMVLLKNEGDLLPVKGSPARIAVIGPNADTIEVLLGNYNGDASAPITILEGLRRRFPESEVIHYPGSGLIDREEMIIPLSALCIDQTCERQGLIEEVFATTDLSGEVVSRSEAREARYSWSFKKDFAVQWTGYLVAPETGDYAFRIDHVDGYRVDLGEGRTIDNWDGDGDERETGTVFLEAGRTYPLVIAMKPAKLWGVVRSFWRMSVDPAEQAVAGAREADLVVMTLGLSPRLEDEELDIDVPGFDRGDRTSLDIPAIQQELMERVTNVGTPTVLVLTNGSALSVNWAADNVPAIVEAWYPGGEGGMAVAELIAGDFSPSGRLPLTFYKGVDQLPDFRDYAMAGRTYRYFDGEPLYPFGHGLSFTRFAYGEVVLETSLIQAGDSLRLTIPVTNVGAVDGDEVVQLYLSRPDLDGTAIRWLAGMARVHIPRGETRQVQFTLDSRAMSTVDQDGKRRVEAGEMKLWVGGGQPVNLPTAAMAPGRGALVTIVGDADLPR